MANNKIKGLLKTQLKNQAIIVLKYEEKVEALKAKYQERIEKLQKELEQKLDSNVQVVMVNAAKAVIKSIVGEDIPAKDIISTKVEKIKIFDNMANKTTYVWNEEFAKKYFDKEESKEETETVETETKEENKENEF